MANGHPDAMRYPIGVVYDEAFLVVEHQNRQMASMGVVIQSATMTTGLGGSKEAAQAFTDLIHKLNDED